MTRLTHDAYLSEVAHAYEQAPLFNLRDAQAWEELACDTMAAYARIQQGIAVVPVAISEPYPTAQAMMLDVARGRLFVSDINHTHPVWSPAVNLAFRVVHDVVGHCTTRAGFDWQGELRAWEAHDAIVYGRLAKRALFTEAVGQVAWSLINGGFGPQKVATLPIWLEHVDLESAVAA